MKIKVLQHHIDEGVRKRVYLCPVALAVKEQTGKSVGVFRASMLLEDGSILSTPPALAKWITQYDDGEPVEPTEFDYDESKGCIF